MVLMNLKIDNYMAFNDFEVNMSYPKKIVGNPMIEYLERFPNYRYRKLNILMGANASGKTSLGRIMLKIFNLIDRQEISGLFSMVDDDSKEASFSMDFIINQPIMYRVYGKIMPQENENDRPRFLLDVHNVDIGKNDSYERCSEKLDKQEIQYTDNYLEALKKIPGIGWAFQLTENAFDAPKLHFNSDKRIHILETVMKVLDPSIQKITKLDNVEDTFVIHLDHRKIIVQDGKVINTNLLSSGTYRGIFVADILARIIEGENGLFIAMPSRKTSDGEYRDIAHPINSEMRGRLQELILSKYEEELAKPQDEE